MYLIGYVSSTIVVAVIAVPIVPPIISAAIIGFGVLVLFF